MTEEIRAVHRFIPQLCQPPLNAVAAPLALDLGERWRFAHPAASSLASHEAESWALRKQGFWGRVPHAPLVPFARSIDKKINHLDIRTFVLRIAVWHLHPPSARRHHAAAL